MLRACADVKALFPTGPSKAITLGGEIPEVALRHRQQKNRTSLGNSGAGAAEPSENHESDGTFPKRHC